MQRNKYNSQLTRTGQNMNKDLVTSIWIFELDLKTTAQSNTKRSVGDESGLPKEQQGLVLHSLQEQFSVGSAREYPLTYIVSTIC